MVKLLTAYLVSDFCYDLIFNPSKSPCLPRIVCYLSRVPADTYKTHQLPLIYQFWLSLLSLSTFFEPSLWKVKLIRIQLLLFHWRLSSQALYWNSCFLCSPLSCQIHIPLVLNVVSMEVAQASQTRILLLFSYYRRSNGYLRCQW